jgi:hypothetical protein
MATAPSNAVAFMQATTAGRTPQPHVTIPSDAEAAMAAGGDAAPPPVLPKPADAIESTPSLFFVPLWMQVHPSPAEAVDPVATATRGAVRAPSPRRGTVVRGEEAVTTLSMIFPQNAAALVALAAATRPAAGQGSSTIDPAGQSARLRLALPVPTHPDPGTRAAEPAPGEPQAMVPQVAAQLQPQGLPRDLRADDVPAPGDGSNLPDRPDSPTAASTGAPAPAGASIADLAALMRGIDAPVGNPKTPETRTVGVDLRAGHWPRAIAAELVMLSNQKVESATLRLSPEHLGQIEVRIHLQQNVVHLSFGAAHPETRTALDQALPQLRDGFAQAGLTLGQATVEQQLRHESRNDAPAPKAAAAPADDLVVNSEARRALSLIDEYA